jgi:outer membrane receptor protein involved in Fe transport
VHSVNAARSNISGVEAGLDIDLSESLSAGLVLNYTHGKQRVGDDPAEPADRVPPLNGRLYLEFDNGKDWHYDGWIQYSGQQDRLSARDIRDIRINPAGTPGWGILGVRGRWNPNQSWQLTITADNLLDKQYRTHGSGLDASGRNLSLGVHRVWD